MGSGGGRVNEKGKCSMSCVPVILCNVAVEPRRRGSSLLSSLKKANWTHRQGQGGGVSKERMLNLNGAINSFPRCL